MGAHGGWLHFEGIARSIELHSMAGMLQSIHHGHDHVAGMLTGALAWIRAVRGEDGSPVPGCLAFGVCGGRDGQERAVVEATPEDHHGHEGRQGTSPALRREQTMGRGLQIDSERTEILAGPDSWSSPGMVSQRSQRESTNPSGVYCTRELAWRSRGTTTSDGVRIIWDDFNIGTVIKSKAGQQRSKRSQEEEMAGRKGGIAKTQRIQKRWRFRKKARRQERREERKRRETGRIDLFLLEQREFALWVIAAGCRVREHGEADAQVFILRVARSPATQMRNQEVKSGEQGGESGGKDEQDEGGKRREEEGGSSEGESNEAARKKLEGKLADYVKKRKFRFLHHYAGPRDPLGAAVHRNARKAGLNVEVIAAEKDWGQDLCDDEPYNTHLGWAKEGLIDGFHAGFPCSTYSRLRFRDAPNLPGPVRTRAEPYGRKANTPEQQRECDRGTVMMARSVQLAEEMAKAPSSSIVCKATSMENPPPSDVEDHVSAWAMTEMVGYLRLSGVKIALFNTCAYQADRARGDRHWKPQQFAGTLYGIESLNRECKCGSARHRPIVGKKESQESGEYPLELCDAYARLLMEHFRMMAEAEYLEGRLREGSQEHDAMSTCDAAATQMREKRNREGVKLSPSPELQRDRRGGLEGGGTSEAPTTSRRAREEDERQRYRERGTRTSAERRRSRSRSRRGRSKDRRREVEAERKAKSQKSGDMRWKPGEGKYGMLREEVKKEQRLEQQDFVGGMKNPMETVEGLPPLQNLGRRILGAWERHCTKHPQAVKVGETYGTPECVLEWRWIERWKEELRKLTGAKGAAKVKLTEKWSYESPLDYNLFEAWGRRANDPETEVHKWIKDGVPLGIELPIKTCGIFPPTLKGDELQEGGDVQAAQGLREDIGNYTSVVEQEEDAKVEIDRLIHCGYAIKVKKAEAEKKGFRGTTISKLGLIVKVKENGTKKRRIIIDLRRSGGNRKAKLPERLVLPRPADAIAMLRRMHAANGATVRPQDKVMELVMIDVSDAYMHLAVAEEEKGHCLAPALDGDHWLLFVALLFGYKTAPLTWSRVAALVARLAQSIIPADRGMHQVYLDDSLWALRGTLASRNSTLACVLTTMAALGLRLSLAKGERAAAVTWIGVNFKLVAPDYDYLLVTLPEKFMDELQKQLQSWEGKGMIGGTELRKAAGRVAWLAGVLPRARWVTASLYAALYSHEEDVAAGKEAERRAQRTDGRQKDHLIPVKRVERARVWLIAYLAAAKERPIRKFCLYKSGKAEVTIMTDASPQGLGAILIVNGRATKALASPVGTLDAKQLGFALGESSSQGLVETLAILVALKHWGKLLTTVSVALNVQSDSVTALAMTQRFSNSSPGLNFLGAELAVECEALGLADLKPIHLPGTANKEADFLSRPDCWATTPLPEALAGIQIETPAERTTEWYRLRPPGPDEADWQGSEALLAAWANR